MTLVPDVAPMAYTDAIKSVAVTKIDKVVAKRKQPSQQHWIDKTARSAVFSLFSTLKQGTLILREAGEVFEFGQPQAGSCCVAEVDIHQSAFYRFIMFGGSVGSGEAYMDGAWTSPDLTRVIEVMVMNMDTLCSMNQRWHRLFSWLGALRYRVQKNSKTGSRRNIAAHYDLSNDFFALFLDPSMMYSAAIYPSQHASLTEAAEFKLQRVCEKLALSDKDHLLEIGSGWGGLAIYCARTTGCKVTTVTLSSEQYQHVKRQIAALGLQERIDVQLCDYRDIQGQYDKLVSIEMIEAVGHQYYADYFAKCARLLKPDGLMLLQAITIPHERFERGKYSMDFIRRYIFPGGCLPSQQIIMQHVAHDTDMELADFTDLTLDYAQTLHDWGKNFNAQRNAVTALGFDEVFMRMWEFYFAYCEGGFRQRVIGTSQWLFAKPRALING